jgi:Na+/H+ antiporter NhaD/arsenite permease-like protein
MYSAILIVFILGYALIALEHTLKIDKAASALLTGTLCWVLLVYGANELIPHVTGADQVSFIDSSIKEHLVDNAEILFFLLGAMTIVEIIDAHEGFSIITNLIKTTKRVKLIWILSSLTFFLSAALDNLTTAIVMAALLRKLIKDQKIFGFLLVL